MAGKRKKKKAKRAVARKRPAAADIRQNKLFYGDNLDILRDCIPDESVDLIYLDPPFKSDATYNILFREPNGRQSPAQIRAFEDTWHWDEAAESAFREVVDRAPPKVVDVVRHMRGFLGSNDMMAYLTNMAIRLLELWRVLKNTGSIYLHCDPTASHYLKIIMDALFDPKNFRREVVWRSGWVSGFKTAAKNWIRNHDILLYYVKGSSFTFNKQFIPHPPGYKRRGGGGRKEGVAIDDVWSDIYSPWIMSFSTEKLGYQTQKPIKLLERIIATSSNPGDLVLDPFCGCGTSIAAAQELGRRWIGIDITHLAVAVIKNRLNDMFGDRVKYGVEGEPVDLPGAKELAAADPYQFQWWALSLVRARPTEPGKKKGADKGVDGVRFFLEEGKAAKKVVVQVKSGHVGVKDVRELRTVTKNTGADVALLVTMANPTKHMRAEAVAAGVYKSRAWGQDYPRVQILTIADLLNRRQPELPPSGGADATFQRAKVSEDKAEQLDLPNNNMRE